MLGSFDGSYEDALHGESYAGEYWGFGKAVLNACA